MNAGAAQTSQLVVTASNGDLGGDVGGIQLAQLIAEYF